MPKDQTCCAECKEPFENGEVISGSGNEHYHHVLNLGERSLPPDCATKANVLGHVSIFYKNERYDLGKVKRLSETLVYVYNSKKTGSLIKGNLEGLI